MKSYDFAVISIAYIIEGYKTRIASINHSFVFRLYRFKEFYDNKSRDIEWPLSS